MIEHEQLPCYGFVFIFSLDYNHLFLNTFNFRSSNLQIRFSFFLSSFDKWFMCFSEYDVNCQSHLESWKHHYHYFPFMNFIRLKKTFFRSIQFEWLSGMSFEVASKIRILCCNCPMIMTHSLINWKLIDLFLASVHRLRGILLLTFPYRITDVAT